MAKIVVLRLGPGDVAASVDFESSDGSAKATQHYESVSGTLEFAKGEMFKEVRNAM